MSALQRIGFVSGKTDRFLAGMVGGPIAVARRGGQTSALQEMLMFYLMNDMIVPGSSYWNMAFGRMPGEAMNDEEGVRTICHFGENVAKVVKAMNR
jgi:multimeric flavodoxin WrbA